MVVKLGGANAIAENRSVKLWFRLSRRIKNHIPNRAIVVEPTGGGALPKSKDQPHAYGYAPREEMRSTQQERHTVPVRYDGKRVCWMHGGPSPGARKGKGIRSSMAATRPRQIARRRSISQLLAEVKCSVKEVEESIAQLRVS